MNKANDITNWRKNFKQVADSNDLSFYQHAYIEDFISELLEEQIKEIFNFIEPMGEMEHGDCMYMLKDEFVKKYPIK